MTPGAVDFRTREGRRIKAAYREWSDLLGPAVHWYALWRASSPDLVRQVVAAATPAQRQALEVPHR